MSSTSNSNGAAVAQAQIVELSEFKEPAPIGPAIFGGNLGLLDSVKVTLNVMVGEVQTTVGELMELKEAVVLKTDRKADYPIDIVVNGNVVARGQLVVVDDHFGVRISELAEVDHA
ncbi:FliM/FliN family flagellar motor switch protein [Janthinobacterium sp. GW460P]|uniref:FliM/FliN family flagellar motor switch protein n=1 Tax=unclassified Janthinobacterium TaxID=2610881 RepID=UPI001481F548|nr:MULTISPECIES: FliM/FliN family flagellar motor switch protein [unclassified Janthinobacterium]MCC7705602.1 FliM/FliN family flagellar motor switch protein [Janthinobacterium sp. GW460P]MCC7711104.1 FliM/FliN family flagellar motor switch protein [Janthinobacterium sp. GW460W]